MQVIFMMWLQISSLKIYSVYTYNPQTTPFSWRDSVHVFDKDNEITVAVRGKNNNTKTLNCTLLCCVC